MIYIVREQSLCYTPGHPDLGYHYKSPEKASILAQETFIVATWLPNCIKSWVMIQRKVKIWMNVAFGWFLREMFLNW